MLKLKLSHCLCGLEGRLITPGNLNIPIANHGPHPSYVRMGKKKMMSDSNYPLLESKHSLRPLKGPSLCAWSLLASLPMEKLGQKTHVPYSSVSQWDQRTHTAPDPRRGLWCFSTKLCIFKDTKTVSSKHCYLTTLRFVVRQGGCRDMGVWGGGDKKPLPTWSCDWTVVGWWHGYWELSKASGCSLADKHGLIGMGLWF